MTNSGYERRVAESLVSALLRRGYNYERHAAESLEPGYRRQAAEHFVTSRGLSYSLQATVQAANR